MKIHLFKSVKNTQPNVNTKGFMRNKIIQYGIGMLFLLFVSNTLFANNIQISNTTLTDKNTTDDFVLVQFDVFWENSWRVSTGPSNWDAAWVFIKYRVTTQATWKHATLHYVDGSGSGDGHTVPTNGVIESNNDNGTGGAHGAFIYRIADMPQTGVSYTGVQLRWDYGIDGVADTDEIEICVLGIEMVYVPQNSFYVGTGNDAVDWSIFYTYPTANTPYNITNENPIAVSPTANSFYYQIDFDGGNNFSGDQLGPIPAEFPKGYKAFYCMKYEITQGQYVAFLNKLPQGGVDSRLDVSTSWNKERNRIWGTFPGTYTTDNPYVVCNYLSWADVAAYLEWSALRPMTELEFEKACKGPALPSQQGIYAWGTTNIFCVAAPLTNAGQESERTTYGSNCSCANGSGNTVDGPVRAGIFAETGNNREQSGATYYGIMEMSGSVWEYTITVGWPAGRAFIGNHGDGELGGPFYEANTWQWPGPDGVGAGFRGGSWSNQGGGSPSHRIDNRRHAAQSVSYRGRDVGGRGVRNAK